jgi:hypothetical protein
MQVRTADCGLSELDNGVGGLGDLGLWTLFEFHITDSTVDERFHCAVGCLADWRAEDVAVGEDADCSEGLHCREEVGGWRVSKFTDVVLWGRWTIFDA